MDHGTAGPDEAWVLLHDIEGDGFEVVPLVPWVSESEVDGDVDANGYRNVTERNWTWDGWDSAIVELSETSAEELGWIGSPGETRFLSLRLRKAGPDVAQAPVAVLTNAYTKLVLL